MRSGRSHHRYATVLAAYDKLVTLVERLDRHGIRAAVAHASIVTADEATLFELLTTFHRQRPGTLRPGRSAGLDNGRPGERQRPLTGLANGTLMAR